MWRWAVACSLRCGRAAWMLNRWRVRDAFALRLGIQLRCLRPCKKTAFMAMRMHERVRGREKPRKDGILLHQREAANPSVVLCAEHQLEYRPAVRWILQQDGLRNGTLRVERYVASSSIRAVPLSELMQKASGAVKKRFALSWYTAPLRAGSRAVPSFFHARGSACSVRPRSTAGASAS
eukprot:4759099-Prymnesium_polylepis.1